MNNALNAPNEYRELSPDEAATLIQQNACTVIDVRTPPEFALHRIAQAQLLPMQELNFRHGEIPKDSPTPLLIVCEHGIRSVAVCQALSHNGWTNVVNLTGGMAHWIDRGLPVVRGPA